MTADYAAALRQNFPEKRIGELQIVVRAALMQCPENVPLVGIPRPEGNFHVGKGIARLMDPTNMRLYADGLCSDLQFYPDTSDKFEAAVNDLAWFLGISGQRPEKDYKEGPDNLWALPNGTFLVIECKNGVTADDGISKKDAGQLGQSIAWFSKRYPASSAVPIMVHPERKLGQGASSVEGMRVIDPKGLEKLRDNLRAFAKQLTDPDIASSASKVAKRLAQFELNADALVNAFSSKVKP